MANELLLNGTLQYEDSNGASVSLQGADVVASVSTKKFIHNIISVGLTEEAIPLGEVSSLGQAMFKNLDATNFIEIRVATSGAKSIKILAGETAGPFRLGSGSQVPYAIADTGVCLMEYVIVST